MSDPERYIEELATELDRVNAFVSKNCKATGLRVLRERLLPVLAASDALLSKLDQVAKDTEGMFVMAHIHGQDYKGVNWSEEYRALRAALAAKSQRVRER